MGDVASHLLKSDDDGYYQGGAGGGQTPRVRSVDLLIGENAIRHNTSGYHRTKCENPGLIVRRGDPFSIRIHFTRDFNRDTDGLVFVFSVRGEKTPTHTKHTVAVVPMDFQASPETAINAWTAIVKRIEEKCLVVEIKPSANCIIGKWIMDIDTKVRGDTNEDASARYRHKDSIYIIFNPWCKDDAVYMEDERKRFEYVLGHAGLIWRGEVGQMKPCIWKYGQFEPDVLECCIYALRNMGGFPASNCSDPVKVSRHISAVINSSDENGILVGNWSNTYSGGMHPLSWTGSTSILQQFYGNKKPVKYGQCWVFAGVCTSVCRALGIPVRSVTNYYSAHDTQESLTVDKFYDEKGKSVDDMNTDSIWNFHVWNEVWMLRPDLEPGDYSGWQVIDSTPQEASGGVYCCGPTSVKAIKRGEILKPYDASFVFAEVNADQISWRYLGPKKPLRMIKKDTDKVGQMISTKAVDAWAREDLTDNYKHPERSKEERDAVFKALRESNHAYSRYYLNEELEDVSFQFEHVNDVIIGMPFTVKLRMTNKNPTKSYTARVAIRIETVQYTGASKKLVKSDSYDIVLKPAAEELLTIDITYLEYARVLQDQCMFNASMIGTIPECKYDFIAQDDFMIRMPDVKLEVQGDLVVNRMLNVTAGFKNPLPRQLSDAYFMIEGPGLVRPLKVPVGRKIPPLTEVKATFQLTPKVTGARSIMAKFLSRDLMDVEGFIEVVIKDAGVNDPVPIAGGINPRAE